MSSPKVINYAGGQKIDNTEMVSQKIHDAVDPVITDLASEVARAQTSEAALQSDIDTLRTDLDKEIQDRTDGDNTLDAKIGDLTSLKTVAKTDVVAAINELHDDFLPIDTALDPDSSHAVENKAIYKGVKDLEKKHDDDMQLEADTRHHADDLLDERVTELEEKLLPMDEVPTEDSEKPAKSGGIFDAIRFASVKVGETMYWHPHEDEWEKREVHSDNPFKFKFKGKIVTVVPEDGFVNICVLKDVPDGWHALDGTAELDADDYPDLAAFMPENVTNDGKIWLPYVQHKIIKIKY